jgi:methylmalonyl-CoA/ethylmalonyl-CoA epimerase
MSKRVHHIGMVVKNVDGALKQYIEMFGVKPWSKGVVEMRKEGLRVAHLDIDGGASIEFMEPTNSESRQGKFLKERGEGVFHINFFTDDFDADVKALRRKGVAVEVEEAKDLFPGYTLRMAWIRPADTRGVWIELADATSVPPEERQRTAGG